MAAGCVCSGRNLRDGQGAALLMAVVAAAVVVVVVVVVGEEGQWEKWTPAPARGRGGGAAVFLIALLGPADGLLARI